MNDGLSGSSKALRHRAKFLLALILVANLAANLVGIDWGLPYHWHTDEKTFNAVDMNYRGSLDPQYFINPHLHLYALAAVVKGAYAIFPGHMHFEYARIVPLTDPNHPHRALQFWTMRLTRGLSALFAVATVFLMYRIGRKHFGEATGLLAAAFLAMTMGFVELAHYATPEAMLFFLVLLALASLDRVLERGRLRDYALAGAAIGLALSTKYTVYLLCIPFLVAHVGRRGWREGFSLRGLAMLALAGLSAGAAFLAGTPYALIHWKDFWDVAVVFNRWTAINFSSPGGDLLNSDRSWLPYLDWLVNILGAPLFVLSLLAIIAAVVWLLERRGAPVERRALLVHASWILSFYAVTGLASMHALRYIMPMVPSMVLLAAVFAAALVRHATSRRARVAAQIAVAGSLVYCAAYTARADWMFLHDTRYAAGEWLSRNLVRSSDEVHYFALDSYIPFFDRPHFKVWLIPVLQTPHPFNRTPDLRRTFWGEADAYMNNSKAVIVDSNFYWDRYILFSWRWPDHDVFYRRLLAGLDPSGYKPVHRIVWQNPWWLDPRPERVSPEIAIFAKPGSLATFKPQAARK
jgi:hypothetical protein